MPKSRARTAKKYFTPEQANATLPLVRAIVRDITTLAESQERGVFEKGADEALQRDRERLAECVAELTALGIELKDPCTGLIDFPSLRDGREVYLCWKLGEPDVEYWHELDAGFAGRQKLNADAPIP
jgi:hypothetical protein